MISSPHAARDGAFGQAVVKEEDEKAAADWVKAGAPAGWTTWQTGADHGTFSYDRKLGAAKVTGVGRSGCFIQSISGVVPGEIYAITARVRISGASTPSIRVRWQTPEGKWLDFRMWSSSGSCATNWAVCGVWMESAGMTRCGLS